LCDDLMLFCFINQAVDCGELGFEIGEFGVVILLRLY
jgi:hypothetical protein